MKKRLATVVPMTIALAMVTYGCAQNGSAPSNAAMKPAVEQVKDASLYKGKIVGRSNKAKSIAVAVGKGDKAKTMMVRFDDATTGLEHAAKGEAAIVSWQMRGSDRYAVSIKPKLARLPAGVSEITPEKVKQLLDGDTNLMIVDSRPAKRYDQSHLPGAVSLPIDEMKTAMNLLPADKNKLLVFYCGGYTCGMSPKAAGLAKKAGYANIMVMLAGEPAWVKAGYPTYASDAFVNKGNIVLIDLRSIEQSEKARIPRSVSIPYDTLEDRVDDIPVKAPVVLYSDDEQEARSALADLHFEGIKSVSLVYGSLDKWLAAPGHFVTGPVVSEISWQRKLGKGEVSPADFEKAVSGKSDALILDVRNRDEVSGGMFPGAINIPLDELTKRAKELPSDRNIYIHCTTGARAEMAYKQLEKGGFKASFLVADVDCSDNNCEIE